MIEGIEDLAGAVTAVLGPVEELTNLVLDALNGVWEELFGSPTPPAGTNWNAYTHEQLYKMLREDADVGDVSAVAAEWGRHASALMGDADALREQLAALQSNWQGSASEQASERLAELRERISGIGTRAEAVQRAAQEAADALALARHTMPPPPADPTGFWMPEGTAPLDAVTIGGTSMFDADVFDMGGKAEAVRVMQRYESSLQQSGHRIAPTPPGGTEARRYQVDGIEGAGTTPAALPGSGFQGTPGGVPWSRLVGGGTLGLGVTAGIGQGSALTTTLAAERTALSDLAAARRPMTGGFFPATGAQGGREGDDDHHNRLPAGDHRLFTLDERSCTAVIGAQ